MKIRLKLALLFTVLFIALLSGFVLLIYYSYAKSREDEYYKRLKRQAITKANLLLDTGTKISPGNLQLIFKHSANSLFQEEVAIYDTSFHLLYHDAVDIDRVKETRKMIDQIVADKEMTLEAGDLQAIGFLYVYNGKDYVITAAAKDEYGLAKLRELKFTISIGFLAAIVLTLLAGRFFAMQALNPVAKLVEKAEEISASNLDLRVDEGNGKDEIAELAVTFNRMLDRLEDSFNAQKQFVSHISHELRTPLSAMIAELELALTKTRETTEYKEMIGQALNDARKLTRLSNGLLDFAKASYDQAEIKFREIRLDELLLDVRQHVIKSNPGYKVNIIFEQEIESDQAVSVNGNEYLLKVAFINLIENGCKFSPDKQSAVSFSFYKGQIILRFSDTGVGIIPDDIPHIFEPFFRGSNKQFADGSGIGLALTQKIIQLHKGKIFVDSEIGKGTTFTVELAHL